MAWVIPNRIDDQIKQVTRENANNPGLHAVYAIADY